MEELHAGGCLMPATLLLVCPHCQNEPLETDVRYERCCEDDPCDVEWVAVYSGEELCPDCSRLMEAV